MRVFVWREAGERERDSSDELCAIALRADLVQQAKHERNGTSNSKLSGGLVRGASILLPRWDLRGSSAEEVEADLASYVPPDRASSLWHSIFAILPCSSGV